MTAVKNPHNGDSQYKDIIYRKRSGRADIVVNRPDKSNTYTWQTLTEMISALQDASADSSLRCIVLSGAGSKFFCSGADINEYDDWFSVNPSDYLKYFDLYKKLFDYLFNCNKVTIARINGLASGGGNEIQMACNLAVMSEDARLSLNGYVIGKITSRSSVQMMSIFLRERLSNEVVYLSDEISSAQAKEWGLVNRVVPQAKLDEEVDAVCAKVNSTVDSGKMPARHMFNFWHEVMWQANMRHLKGVVASSAAELAHLNACREGANQASGVKGLAGADNKPGSVELVTCKQCGKLAPGVFKYCGLCGAKL